MMKFNTAQKKDIKEEKVYSRTWAIFPAVSIRQWIYESGNRDIDIHIHWLSWEWVFKAFEHIGGAE